jgi:hypothetical protein
MRRMRERDRARGLVEVSVSVPADRVEELRLLVAGWEREHRSQVERMRAAAEGQTDLLHLLDLIERT